MNETRNPQHIIVVDRYLRFIAYETIPDSAEPRLESFYPPFVAGIELPHQGVVDSYSLLQLTVWDSSGLSEIDLSHIRIEYTNG